MKILKLNASNIDAILEIERESFSAPWTRGMFAEEFSNPAFHCFGAADSSGAGAGFVCFWKVLDEIHIGNIAVRPAYRRRGIAKSLLDAVIAFARANSVEGLTLEVRRGNAAAIALYTAAGFKTEGMRPRYYENGEDALIMWRREN